MIFKLNLSPFVISYYVLCSFHPIKLYGEGLQRHCLLPNPFMSIYICISKYVQIKSAYLILVGSQVVLFVLFPDKPGKKLRIMSLTRFVDTMFMYFGTLNDLARNGR